MQICYEYVGLAKYISSLSSTELASWVEAIFTGLGAIATAGAAWAALYVYSKSRRDQQTDMKRRRDNLNAMLEYYVVRAAQNALTTRDRVLARRYHIKDVVDLRLELLQVGLNYMERMNELQMQLIEHGSSEDMNLASFLESCRRYDVCHASSKLLTERSAEILRGDDGVPMVLIALLVNLDDLAPRAEEQLRRYKLSPTGTGR